MKADHETLHNDNNIFSAKIPIFLEKFSRDGSIKRLSKSDSMIPDFPKEEPNIFLDHFPQVLFDVYIGTLNSPIS